MLIHFKLNKEFDKKLIAKFLTLREAGVDFSKSILKYHPVLESAISLSRVKQKSLISKCVDAYYQQNNSKLKQKLREVKAYWNNIETEYFSELQKIGFEYNPLIRYTAYLSVINACPRVISTKSFWFGYNMKIENDLRIICHEVLHFFFYDYISRYFPNQLSTEQKWHLSEIFNYVILNQPQFSRLFYPSLEQGYPIHREYLPGFTKLYKESNGLDDFMKQAISSLKQIALPQTI